MTELLYPGRCPLCQKISEGVCSECLGKTEMIGHPRCFRCGKPLSDDEKEYCYDCGKNSHKYDQGRGLFSYDGDVREAIHRIKYENKREYLETFADLMAEYLSDSVRDWNPQVLIPIPMYRKKKAARGFNQAEILAELLGTRLGIAVDSEWLLKQSDTAEQKKLTKEERKKSLTDAFCVSEQGRYRFVILVDDVYTTGSTMDAAAAVLREAGAERICFLTICIGSGDGSER